MSSLSYLRSKLALICLALAGSPVMIGAAMASSSAMKAPDVGGITGLSGAVGNQRLSSLSSATEVSRYMRLRSLPPSMMALVSRVVLTSGLTMRETSLA
jgi:hypothetical protein